MAEPTKQNTSSIPESVTINGVTYSVSETPELQKFIQDVAKVEKSKLYSQFESLREQLKNLSNVQVTPENKETLDINSIVEALKDSFVSKEDFKESLKSTVEEVVRPVLDATKQSQENELKAYREKLITENAATCIPEIVKGTTKEELDASLKESIRLRAAYPSPGNAPQPYKGDPNIEKAKGSAEFSVQEKTPTPSAQSAPAQAPAAPHRPSPDASKEPEGVRKMSMKEFAQKRDTIRQQLESVYGGSSM